jgi:hypothetical protein
MRRRRSEADAARAVRPHLDDLVKRALPGAARAAQVFQQVTVELQHDIPVEPDVGGVGMDRRQRVAIAGDFAFRAVLRLRLPAHQRLDAAVRRHHALDPV